MDFLAHISEDRVRSQLLIDHLSGTAKMAAEFATPLGMAERAFRCGLAHDIGKYSLKFQRRLNGSSEKVDHSTAGAIVLGNKFKDAFSAFCIAGHHGGLPNGGNRVDSSEFGTLCGRMKRKENEEIEPFGVYAEELSLPDVPFGDKLDRVKGDKLSAFFGTRMLYSCLVDADYLDTEQFMNGGSVTRGGYCSLSEMETALHVYMERYSSDSLLNQKRSEIRRAILTQAEEEKGLFSLTVPTGGGKTLASVSFALRHALSNGLSRVIYVIPYCSIIEQTQKVFSEVFGEENVIAHYGNVEYNTEENEAGADKRYLSAENWDAPLILTTAVQFFESLYANRSTACRKLHNIANSIVVFDEAQMLPVPYLRPCISAVSLLVRDYSCSAVLCTATQPSLSQLFEMYLPGVPIRELYRNSQEDLVFQRVRYRYEGLLTDATFSTRISEERQVLCIVNNRRQAQELFSVLPEEGAFCLTTALYPKHRREALDAIRERLKNGQICRVISTSLIEAGVDVDFPTVYRAIAGLDSICQSGGRCNREGRKSRDDSIVHVFETEQKSPNILRKNIEATRRIIAEYGDKMTSPEAIRSYFDFLFYVLKDDRELDIKDIMGQILNDFFPFEAVARDFKLIETSTRTVYVLNRNEEGKILAHEVAQGNFSRRLWRKLGQYAVAVYKPQYDALKECCALDEICEGSAILIDGNLYSEKTGLTLCPPTGGLLEL